MKEIVRYNRVSTKCQGDSGLGLASQTAMQDHYYSREKGYITIGEFTDIKSGKNITARTELKKAIQMCKDRGATLTIAKVDRLSRNTEDTISIYNQVNKKLESCDIPNLDKFTLILFSAIAEREREIIGLRTKQALDIKKEVEGEWRTGTDVFKSGKASKMGIDAVRKKAAANENNMKASAFLKQFDKSTLTLQQKADMLNENGFVTSRGNQFEQTQVKRLMDRYREEKK